MRATSRTLPRAAREWQDFVARGLDFADPGGDNGA